MAAMPWTIRGHAPTDQTVSTPPPMPKWLGFAGLLPQGAVVAVLLAGITEWRFVALAVVYAYAALILSFLGGMWWGLAARADQRAPPWMWLVAIGPSLIALMTAVPSWTGEEWPGPSLVILGIVIGGSLIIDYRLQAAGVCPEWWMGLRIPLSLGLGTLTIAAAALAGG